jgi:hypothetical protein
MARKQEIMGGLTKDECRALISDFAREKLKQDNVQASVFEELKLAFEDDSIYVQWEILRDRCWTDPKTGKVKSGVTRPRVKDAVERIKTKAKDWSKNRPGQIIVETNTLDHPPDFHLRFVRQDGLDARACFQINSRQEKEPYCISKVSPRFRPFL